MNPAHNAIAQRIGNHELFPEGSDLHLRNDAQSTQVICSAAHFLTYSSRQQVGPFPMCCSSNTKKATSTAYFPIEEWNRQVDLQEKNLFQKEGGLLVYCPKEEVSAGIRGREKRSPVKATKRKGERKAGRERRGKDKTRAMTHHA